MWLALSTLTPNPRSLVSRIQASDEVPNGGLDGDVVFRPCKVENAGLSDAVDGRVLIHIKKHKAFENVEPALPG